MSAFAKRIERAVEGDRAEIQELLREYDPILRGYARKKLGGDFNAKFDESDVVQHTLLDAYNAIGDFRGRTQAAFTTWLTCILERNITTQVRAYTTQRRNVRLESRLSNCQNTLSCSSRDNIVSFRVEQQENASMVANALSELTERQRLAILMRFWKHRRLAEIAKHMNVSVRTVTRLIERGLAELRGRLVHVL